jgi:ATP-dependent DNA helicase RecG
MRLADHLTDHFRLTDVQKDALKRLGLATVEDLLHHFPSRYDQGGSSADINNLVLGAEVTIVGTLEKLKTKKSWKRKIPVSEGAIKDQSGTIKCMWFNQPYIAKMYAEGTHVRAVGKVAGSAGKLYLANPRLEKVSITDLEAENFYEKWSGRARRGCPRTFFRGVF